MVWGKSRGEAPAFLYLPFDHFFYIVSPGKFASDPARFFVTNRGATLWNNISSPFSNSSSNEGH